MLFLRELLCRQFIKVQPAKIHFFSYDTFFKDLFRNGVRPYGTVGARRFRSPPSGVDPRFLTTQSHFGEAGQGKIKKGAVSDTLSLYYS